MNRQLLFLYLFLLLNACEPPLKTFSINVEEPDPFLVAYGFWNTNMPFSLLLSSSIGAVSGGDLSYIPDARVLIYSGDTLIDSLTFQDNFYRGTSTVLPMPGVEYRLEASHPRFSPITATCLISAFTGLRWGDISPNFDTIGNANLSLPLEILSQGNTIGLRRYSADENIDIFYEIDKFRPRFGLRNLTDIDSLGRISLPLSINRFFPNNPVPEEMRISRYVLYQMQFDDEFHAFQDFISNSVDDERGGLETNDTEILYEGNVTGGFGVVSSVALDSLVINL